MKQYILMLACLPLFLSILAGPAESKEVIGWLEMIRIYPGNLKIRAKMDTGAKGSAINAYNLKTFEQNQEPWVSFELRDNSKNAKTKQIFLEKKIVNTIRLKVKGGGLEERLVVNMEVCLAGIHKEIKMSLIDRSNFNYQVLIGRADLENDFIVDPSLIFTHKPACKVSVKLDK